METILKKILSLLHLCFFVSIPFIYAQAPVNDTLTDTVRCRSVPGQSYSLYLPAQYDNKKSWPVILIFDPGARGRTGVTAFLEAGRQYGFILACSNNSHNGPFEDNFKAAVAMQQDVAERFNTDRKRIYAAGFSGGSRFALVYAVRDKSISGVIGCGAGLPNDRVYNPSFNSRFLYYGLTGTRDMNYLEMNSLPGFLNNRTSVISYLRTFDGGHQWPESGLITEAVEWIILQTMKSKIIASDQTFLSYVENKTQSLINSQLTTGNLYEAMMYARFASRDFEGTPFASRMAQQVTDNEKSDQYQAVIRKRDKLAANERKRTENYYNYLTGILNSGSLPDSASAWWKNETRDLVRLRDKGSPENSLMASRLLNFISIQCSEQASELFRIKYYEQAAFLFKICSWSDSENKYNYYNLARALALSGKSRESVDALTAAFNHGFTSRKTVESDQAFGKIRSDPRYKTLIIKMK